MADLCFIWDDEAEFILEEVHLMKALGGLKPGQSGTVVAINTVGALKRRLVDMGITPGVRIMVRKVAPLGDPIEINLRGYELTVRKTEAQNIVIEDILE